MRKVHKYYLLFLLCPMVLSCSNKMMENHAEGNGVIPYEATITSPQNGQSMELLNSKAASFVNGYINESMIGSSKNYSIQGEELYYPEKVHLTWDAQEGYEYFLFNLSLDEEMNNSQTYIVYKPEIDIGDLFIDSTYYYQIYAYYTNQTIKSRIFSFTTNNSVRTIKVEDVSNTRDIGGMVTVDGRYRIKQGLVYRGAQLDMVTDATYLLDVLNIKSDINLRQATDGIINPLHLDKYYAYGNGCPFYAGTNDGIDIANLDIEGTRVHNLVNYMKQFANVDNYPTYFHCQVGRDRTGTVAVLLEGLLGIGKVEIYRDYELSYLSYSGTIDTNPQQIQGMINGAFNPLYNYLENYGSGTFQENVSQYLIDIGMTAEELNTIRNFLLEEI